MKILLKKLLALNLSLLMLAGVLLNVSAAYAVGSADDKVITYMGNGGTTKDGEEYYYQSVISYDDVTLPGNGIFTKGEYTLVGWKDQDGNDYYGGRTYSFDGPILLTAQWDYVRISYHMNPPEDDGSIDTSTPYTTASTSIERGNIYACDGYSFVGWNTKADGSGVWHPETKKLEGPVGVFDLYAQWIKTPENYICFSAEGTDNLEGRSYEYVEITSFPAKIKLPDMSNTDSYICIGWSTAFGSPNVEKDPCYSPGEVVSFTETTTLYAWQKPLYSYAIVHYGNGGTNKIGSSVKVGYSTGADLALYNVNAFTNEGHRLVGWNTKADGTGISYEPCERLGKDSYNNKISYVYAQWEETTDPYVAYIGNGGTTGDGKAYYYQSVDSNNLVTLLGADLFTNWKFIFSSWKDEYGRIYYPGKTYRLTEPIVLTAQWDYARISYHLNSPAADSSTGASTPIVSTSRTVLSGDTFTCDGYSFVGWNTKADGRGTWYVESKDLYTPLGVVDFYAQWIKTPENYVCYCAKGAGFPGNKSREYVEIDSFPAQIKLPDLPTTYSYASVGVGWSTVPTHSSTWNENQKNELSYSPNTTVTFTENTTLYIWTTDRYKSYTFIDVIYHGNGGTNEIGSTVEVQYTSWGSLYLYDINSFVNEGHRLVEWNTEADGTGVSYMPEEVLSYDPHRNRVLSLYAQWEEVTGPYITYMGNGGKTSDGRTYSYQSVGADGSVTLPGKDFYTRKGYYLYGWLDTDSHSIWVPGCTLDVDTNMTLRAIWMQVLYGDLNRDGAINASDAVLLAQYMASWDVEIDEVGADCNGSGSITAADAVLLAQYLAGWNVALG